MSWRPAWKTVGRGTIGTRDKSQPRCLCTAQRHRSRSEHTRYESRYRTCRPNAPRRSAGKWRRDPWHTVTPSAVSATCPSERTIMVTYGRSRGDRRADAGHAFASDHRWLEPISQADSNRGRRRLAAHLIGTARSISGVKVGDRLSCQVEAYSLASGRVLSLVGGLAVELDEDVLPLHPEGKGAYRVPCSIFFMFLVCLIA